MSSYNSFPSGYKAKHAASVYKANSNEGLSEREMMAKLHQKIINQLYLARDAYLAGNLESMLDYNYKVIHITDVLRQEMLATSETMKEDPEASISVRHHANIYAQILERTTNVLQKKPPEEEFTSIIDFVKPLYEAWLPAKQENTETVDQPSEPDTANTNVAG